MMTLLAGMPVVCSICWRARTTCSTGYFNVSKVTIATFCPPAERTNAFTYRRVLTAEDFFGAGEPASTTGSVGVMSTLPTPASR
jgi:hypothetical protein